MDLRFPIGQLQVTENITEENIKQWIHEIAQAPHKLEEAVSELAEEQLDTPYRPNGWTVRQVVHHLADAHLNGITRFKLGLTEVQPTIKTFNEVAWVNLPDSRLPIDVSITLLSSVHKRMVTLLESLNKEDLKKTVFHPENGIVSLEKLIATYAWHGNHHIAHITSLRERMGW